MRIRSILPTQQRNDLFYEVLPIVEEDNTKMVCNPNRSAGSPTRTGTRICTKAGGSHDESLFPLSPHLSLEVDWVAGQPNAASCDTERTDYHHRGKKNLWVKYLWPVNPLEQPAPAMFLQN
jgi:hypothetical protein